jgi:hypothetical protein
MSRVDGSAYALAMWSRILPALLLSAATPIAFASGLGFLKDSPVSYFNEDDLELMRKNATAVLDAATSTAEKREWRNAKTGNSGNAQVTGRFTATDGAPCRKLRIENRASGLHGVSTYTVCKYEDRGWVLHADAQPARSASK